MRRLATRETLHGTRDGQILIDAHAAARFGLSGRESACAALLGDGLAPQEIADRLDISLSTVEKHLVSIRRKLGVSTTLQAVVTLLRQPSRPGARQPDAFGIVLPFAADQNAASDGPTLARSLREAPRLESQLEILRDSLREDGLEGLFYAFLPFAAASARKGDAIHRRIGPRRLLAAIEDGAQGPFVLGGRRLFAEPDRAVFVDLTRACEPEMTRPLAEACRKAELTQGITLGSPFGTGYVIASAFYRDRRDASCRSLRATRLRERMLLLQNAAYSFGSLASTAGLTARERDLLAMVASGCSTRAAARALRSSERAVGQCLRNARTKLHAQTTAEAVSKAVALNALVFR